MTITWVAVGAAVLCLVALPSLMRGWSGFDRLPLVGFVVWGSMCVIGWSSVVVTCLRFGLGTVNEPLARNFVAFVEHLGDGHPLRGLGLVEVVGISIAFDVTVLMAGALVVTAWRVWGVRSRQRTVLDLVAESNAHEGVCLLKHPYPMAYFLPGDGGRVVLSTGAVDLLSALELEAVIEHELGHRSGRHGALLIPLQVLSSFVAFLPLARYAPSVMRTYLEMSADDYSRSRGSADALKAALAKAALFQPPPAGAMSVADGVIDRRINRLGVAPATRRSAPLLVGVAALAASLLWLLVMGH